MCREPDISATGGWKSRIIRRLAGRAPSSMVISSKLLPNIPVVTIGDGRPTWKHRATNKPSRTHHITEFAYHPARSAHTRYIHPASAASTSITPISIPKRAFGHNVRTSADFVIHLSIHNNNILCNDRITKNRFHQTLHLIQVESGSEMECC